MYKVILAALSGLIILTGCNTQKKEVERLEVYAVRYPNQFKVLANTLDPCFNGVAKRDTIIVKGKADTVLTPGSTSTVTTLGHDTVFVTKTVTTQGKTITVPIIKTIRDTVINNRVLQATQALFSIKSDSLVVVRTQLIQTRHSRSIWMWIAIGCMGLILIFFIAKIVIFFNGGGYASVVKKVI
jgi:hypothetical protein